MVRKKHINSQKVIDSFLSSTFHYLVENIAPGYFRVHGHVPDEESVAATEALALLRHLQDERQIPPHMPANQARQEAEYLFRNRLKWRIKTMAPRWRKTTSLSAPDSPAHDQHDQHPGNQPERTAITKDLIQWVRKALRAEKWSPEEIALYLAYEAEELSLTAYASALSLSTDAAKQRASRTRKRLQKRLGQLAEPLYTFIYLLLRQRYTIQCLAMFEKLAEVEARYEELTAQMMDPTVATDPSRYRDVAREHTTLTRIVETYREWKAAVQGIADAEEMTSDPEMKELAQAELDELKPKLPELEKQLKVMLIPKDPADDNDVIMEFRPGTGGDEAELFCYQLLRMYMRYAERMGWQSELLEMQETGIGGVKDAQLSIKAHGAYSQMKFEGGVHRVQRVPVTESGGRIHTSTATVAVMPEVGDVEIHIDEKKDLRRDHFLSAGAGGQNVQKNETAVRLTHLPTGIVVACPNQRSQLQNYESALRVLRARLYEMEMEKQLANVTQNRKLQVGSGDRSDKIRTYNFKDDRVTDHRIGLTVHGLPSILDGDIQHIIDALVTTDQADKLGEGNG